MHSVKFRESIQKAGDALGCELLFRVSSALQIFGVYRNSIVHAKALAKRTHKYTQLLALRLLCMYQIFNKMMVFQEIWKRKSSQNSSTFHEVFKHIMYLLAERNFENVSSTFLEQIT